MPARPRKTRPSQKHQVDLVMRSRDITRAGTSLKLEVFAGGEKLGELIIGSGSISWRGNNRRYTECIPWTKFAAQMDELAYGA